MSNKASEDSEKRMRHEVALAKEELRQYVEKSMQWKEEEARLNELVAQQDETASMYKALRDEFEGMKVQLDQVTLEKDQAVLDKNQANLEKQELSHQLAIATAEGGKPSHKAKFARGVWAQSGVSPKFWSPGEKRSPSALELGRSPSVSPEKSHDTDGAPGILRFDGAHDQLANSG